MWVRRRIELDTLRSNVGFLTFNRDVRMTDRAVDGEADKFLSWTKEDEAPVDLD